MSAYIDLSKFKHIYVVDLCKSLCEQAKKKVIEKKWTNVTVIEGDACEFVPKEGTADLVTFSYSLSMIPTFHAAIDRAISYLHRDTGLLAITDFYTSAKYDLPMRQMSWSRRFFWRSIFDTDSIDLGPERRQYLDHALSRIWDFNSEGSIPYVPYFRAPFYVSLYRVPKLETMLIESKVEAPPMFPPTFLYTQSWEDPAADVPHLRVGQGDVCLTLTSGGCNSLALSIHGAKAVYSVDCNPAQNALLELKQVAIRRLEFEDVWAMFGLGKHPDIESIFERELAPFLSQTSLRFWSTRLHYFKDGLYYQGGMGKVVWAMQLMARTLGLGGTMKALLEAPTLEAQRKIWNSTWVVRMLRTAPGPLLSLISDATALLFFNRVTLWFGAGVPLKQYELIKKDGIHMSTYVSRCFDGVAQHSHLRSENYFYYNCLAGEFHRENCPAYLTPEGFAKLKAGAVDSLHIRNNFFLPELRSRKYSKVILMDHVDWLDETMAREVAVSLGQQVIPGGRVILRSAALNPPYVKFIEEAGFEVRCLQRIDQGYMDRVNSYASFFVCVKTMKRE